MQQWSYGALCCCCCCCVGTVDDAHTTAEVADQTPNMLLVFLRTAVAGVGRNFCFVLLQPKERRYSQASSFTTSLRTDVGIEELSATCKFPCAAAPLACYLYVRTFAHEFCCYLSSRVTFLVSCLLLEFNITYMQKLLSLIRVLRGLFFLGYMIMSERVRVALTASWHSDIDALSAVFLCGQHS